MASNAVHRIETDNVTHTDDHTFSKRVDRDGNGVARRHGNPCRSRHAIGQVAGSQQDGRLPLYGDQPGYVVESAGGVTLDRGLARLLDCECKKMPPRSTKPGRRRLLKVADQPYESYHTKQSADNSRLCEFGLRFFATANEFFRNIPRNDLRKQSHKPSMQMYRIDSSCSMAVPNQAVYTKRVGTCSSSVYRNGVACPKNLLRPTRDARNSGLRPKTTGTQRCFTTERFDSKTLPHTGR